MIPQKNIFIVGIKGVAMANLAVIFKKMGKNVFGSDLIEEYITDGLLAKNKIDYEIGFATALPSGVDLVIYSAAHQGINNPQVREATKRGIKIISQAEILGMLTQEFKQVVAVCGCHGKTTTSSLAAYCLIKLGLSPGYLVGAPEFNGFPGGDYHDPKKISHFVVEADEYGVNPPKDKTPKFHFLKPNDIICTNIDYDHPDVYDNIKQTKDEFAKFFDQSIHRNNFKTIFICQDDKNSREIISRFEKKYYLTWGFSKQADFKIGEYHINHHGSVFSLITNRGETLKFQTKLYGEKNISNAAGVITFLLTSGFHYQKIVQAIKNFTGAVRRFELVYRHDDSYLFDDYGHHPNEIKATIEAARMRFPKRRILIIFQPHTYSRTQSLLKEFRKSLSLSDMSFILPIFASAREKADQFTITAKDIVDDEKNLFYVESMTQLINQLSQVVKKGDIVFTMGAGDVYKLKRDIINIISKLNTQSSKL